uniref:Uncharacterized protein n=1 Tax=viral metagenome TaxID=1070528 RepID=A0A6H1ZHY6_9ZZZZ
MKNIFSMDGVPGTTFTMTSTNASQALTAASLLSANGNRAIAALITCETNDVKFVFGATPVSSGLGHVLGIGASIMINNSAGLKSFRFISSTADAHGVLQITPFFEPGR